MSQPVVTVAIPTYQRPVLLRRAIRSVLDQTYPHVRCVVLDNASGDATGDVVRELAAADSRVEYVCHPHNLGATANFRAGLDHAETEYFVLLSDDDALLPEFFARAVPILETDPEIIFYAGTCIYVDDRGRIEGHSTVGWSTGVYEPPEGAFGLVERQLLTWTAILFRDRAREVIRAHLRGDSCADWAAQIALALRHRIHVDLKAVALYFAHSSSWGGRLGFANVWSSLAYVFSTALAMPGAPPAQRWRFWTAHRAAVKRLLRQRPARSLGDFGIKARVAWRCRAFPSWGYGAVRKLVSTLLGPLFEPLRSLRRRSRARALCASCGLREDDLERLVRDFLACGNGPTSA